MTVWLKNVFMNMNQDGVSYPVLENVSLEINPGRYALLSDVAEARRPIIDAISGIAHPEAGQIVRQGRASWPIGRVVFAHRDMTGFELIDLFVKLYDLEVDLCVHLLYSVISDKSILDENVGAWTQFSRIEFCNTLALVPEFSTYVIDGHIDLGMNQFTRFWRILFAERTKGKTVIISTYNPNLIFQYADQALICSDRRLLIEPNLDRALSEYPLVRAANYRTPASDQDEDDDAEG